MNEKFYALPEEKQCQILNATYKVFATNQYKKAPTSEIAAGAGISGNDKSLGNSLWKGDGKWPKTVIRHPVVASIIL